MIYPFIVSNPGEAAQAKRRIAAVTIGHLPPPLVETELSRRGAGARTAGRRICDRRRARPAAARASGAADRRDGANAAGLAREAGVAGELHPDEALRKIDAWLCDLKDLAVKDGLHIYGRATGNER